MADIGTAKNFLNSIGISTAVGSYIDAYKNSSLVVDTLNYLGVTTIRTAYTSSGEAAPVLSAIADAGFKFDFHIRSAYLTNGTAGINAFVSDLKAFAAEHPGAVVAIEGVNEANLNTISYKGLSGVEAAAQVQRDMYTAIKADPALSSVSVYNLSIGNHDTASYAAMGDMQKYSDYGNAHVYTATGAASDKQFESGIDLAADAVGGKPVVVTETGHTTLESFVGMGASDTAQAKLMLNNLFFAFEDGSQQTYLYELFDQPTVESVTPKEGHFGLFNADGSPKAAATALHNLTTILSFGEQATGSATTASYTLSGASSATHSMQLQKGGGVYDIVVWADKVVWNSTTLKDVLNPAVQTTVDLGAVHGRVYVYDPLSGTNPIAVYTNVQKLVIPVSDHPLIIEVDAAGPVTETKNVSEAHVTMTADDLVAHMGQLSATEGLQSITLTDTHELAVSSASTMQYMISKYGDLLAKIDGGFSFSVSYGQPTWTKVLQYDQKGTLVQRTDYGITNGVTTSKTVYAANGGHDYYKYGISGQSYVTEHQTVNAAGKIVAMERLDAKGVHVYSETTGNDGSKTTIYYSNNGDKSSEYRFATDGSFTTLTYGNKNVVTREIVKQANGDTLTTQYSNAGVKTQVVSISHLGDIDTKNYDASGKLANETLKHADGSFVYTTYAANGAVTSVQDKHVNGSYDFYRYGVTGQNYVTEHQTFNTAGKIVALERLDAKGGRVYSEATGTDGSKTTTYYASNGDKSSEYRLAADASMTTLTYGNKNIVTREIVKQANGDTLTTQYSNSGVKTQAVAVSRLGDVDTKNYDASGKLANDTLKHTDGSFVYTTYATSGAVTSVQDKHANGSSDYYRYGVTGQNYVTEHQTLNAAGKVVALERLDARGGRVYSEATGTDGSKTTTYYASNGDKSSEYRLAADGSVTTLTYGNKNIVTREIVKQANGDMLTTQYSNAGVKTQAVSVSRLGDVDTKNYDANGKLATDTLKHTDGSFVYTTYAASGAVTSVQDKHVNGSYDFYRYGVTGQNYVTEHQTFNAAGKVVALERLDAKGGRVYAEATGTDGSKTTTYYASNGDKSSEYRLAADGSTTTLTYGSKNVVTREIVKQANGDTLNTQYSNAGVKAQAVSTSHLGDVNTKNYDANGKLANETLKHTDGSFVYTTYAASGAVTSMQDKHVNGSYEFYIYGVTGQNYATEHQTVKANGQVVGIERLDAKNVRIYQQTIGNDGSKTTVYYSAAGDKTSQNFVAADGTITSTTYAANNVVTSENIKQANGDTLNTLYNSAGVKTQAVSVSHLGDVDTKNYDASGKLANETLKHSDGSLVYTTYTSTGAVSSVQDKHVNGSYDYYKYGITGQSYVTEHQTFNTAGKVVALERLDAKGIPVYSETSASDGSAVKIYYTATGDKASEYHIAADGSKVVDVHLQDGSGAIRSEHYNTSNTLVQLDTQNAAGQHTIYAYGDKQILAGGTGDDTISFRTTSGGTLVYNGGHDTVSNFDFSGTSQEHIKLIDALAGADSHAVFSQQDNDALVTFDDHNSLLFKNTLVSQVHWDVLS